MIIDDFDRMRVLTMPAKTNAPLVIYANAVLSVPTTLERFEAIAGRQAHDLEPIGGIKLKKLASGNPLNVAWQATRRTAAEDLLSLVVGETLNHLSKLAPEIITSSVINQNCHNQCLQTSYKTEVRLLKNCDPKSFIAVPREFVISRKKKRFGWELRTCHKAGCEPKYI